MDLRSTAPAERGREAAGEASPRRDAWPVPAAPKRRLRLPAQRIARKKKRAGEGIGEIGETTEEGRGWKAAGGRVRPGASGQVAILPRRNGPLFFFGGFGQASLAFFFQVISARRGGAAADAVVGAGGQKPARVRGAAAPRHRAQAQAE